MEELLPQLQITVPEKTALDPRSLFTTPPDSVWLEIGFGGGEHLAAQAKRHPSIGFIGCEPFVNGIASLLDHADREQLQNVRIYPNDARILIDALPDNSLSRCFVLFADPWPKARHAERRFIGLANGNINALARVLKPNAELHLATDHATLAAWMKDNLDGSPLFSPVQYGQNPPEGWVQTRYEQKALKAGRQATYMLYKKLDSTPSRP